MAAGRKYNMCAASWGSGSALSRGRDLRVPRDSQHLLLTCDPALPLVCLLTHVSTPGHWRAIFPLRAAVAIPLPNMT